MTFQSQSKLWIYDYIKTYKIYRFKVIMACYLFGTEIKASETDLTLKSYE